MSKEFEKELAKIIEKSLDKLVNDPNDIFELFRLHNKFCEENNYYDSFIFDNFESYAEDYKVKDVFNFMRQMMPKTYTVEDILEKPIFFNGYGNINLVTVENNPIDTDLIANWIVENDLFEELRGDLLDYDAASKINLYDIDLDELKEKFENKVEKKSSLKP